MDTYQFRKTTSTDLPSILELVNIAYRSKTLRGWTSEADLIIGQRIDINQLKALITEHSELFVMQFNDHLIGCVHLELYSAYCYIGMLTTHPNFQNKGIGKQLLQHAEKYAISHYSLNEFRISVLSAREELIQFYQRRGYQLTDEQTPYPIHANVGTPQIKDLCVIHLIKRSF